MKSSPDRGMEPQVYQEILNTLHEKADFTTP
jgi:hypothetical protein